MDPPGVLFVASIRHDLKQNFEESKYCSYEVYKHRKKVRYQNELKSPLIWTYLGIKMSLTYLGIKMNLGLFFST